MKCQGCSQTVTKKTKFCPNCGEQIIKRTSAKQVGNNQANPFIYGVGFLVLGILIGFSVFKFSQNSSAQAPVAASTVQSAPGIQTAAVLEVAKEFMCFCGTCDDPLDSCKCEHPKGALEVKQFIAQKLQEGHKKNHIVELVQSQYGRSLNLDNLNRKILQN